MCLKIQYWSAENIYQLYDSATPSDSQPQQLDIFRSTSIFRNQKTYDLVTEKQVNKKQKVYKSIFNIQGIRGRYAIANSSSQQDLYLVVGNQHSIDGTEPVKLKQSSVFKCGRSRIQINKIKYDKGKRMERKTFYEDNVIQKIQQKNRIGEEYYENSSKASTIEEAPCCRYCYQKSIEQQNLFVILCKCEGSTKYVHEMCLKNWICQKSNYKQTHPGIFYAEKEGLRCEICQQQFPIEQILPCFNNTAMKQYIILTVQIQKTKIFRIISLSEQHDTEILIGRKEDSHIMIPDISVSRQHCRLFWRFKEGTLILQDLGSKYGTLLKKQGLEILKPTYMQHGRTRFFIQVIPKQNIFKKTAKSIMKLITSNKPNSDIEKSSRKIKQEKV